MLGMSPTLLSHKWRPDTSTKRVKNNETVTMGSTALPLHGCDQSSRITDLGYESS